jgi:triacylglycerol esterase/lipase EstA (alpha/beta hydrolase family)
MKEQEKIETDDMVILVHGTFASTEKGWASKHSNFIFKLLQYHLKISGHYMNYTTFKWSGHNSLYERQMAAINLAEIINLNTKNHKRIHLIGHSHGGNVIQYALQSYPIMVSNQWKLKVASWTTIGTPFYRFKGNLRLTNKGNYIWTTLSSIAVTLIFHYWTFGAQSKVNWISSIVFILLIVIFERFYDAYSIRSK